MRLGGPSTLWIKNPLRRYLVSRPTAFGILSDGPVDKLWYPVRRYAFVPRRVRRHTFWPARSDVNGVAMPSRAEEAPMHAADQGDVTECSAYFLTKALEIRVRAARQPPQVVRRERVRGRMR